MAFAQQHELSLEKLTAWIPALVMIAKNYSDGKAKSADTFH